VNDGVDPFDGLREGSGIGEVAADGGRVPRRLHLAPDEGATVEAGIGQPWKQPRADQTGCSGEKNGSQDDPFH
jgi:hypothetical protein